MSLHSAKEVRGLSSANTGCSYKDVNPNAIKAELIGVNILRILETFLAHWIPPVLNSIYQCQTV